MKDNTTVGINRKTLNRLRATNPEIIGVNAKINVLLDIHDSLCDKSECGPGVFNTHDNGITCKVYTQDEWDDHLSKLDD